MKPSRALRAFSLNSAEPLEPRIALSAEGLAWGNAPYLSISFAPDGTEIDGHSSQLFSVMNSIALESDWQQAIVDGFQTWARNTNGDVFVTPDSGEDFGVPGRTFGDERFGDVRIGAIPLRSGVFAIAVSGGFLSGTWSGDVLFNSDLFAGTSPLRITSIDEVFRIALHEAGHVYGFEHAMDPDGVMRPFGISLIDEPSPDELDELWVRFGARSPDINEHGNRSNDTPEDATHMYSSDDGFDGTTPLIHHGDIGDSDIDFFRFDNLDITPDNDYVGDVTFEVRADGLSQLHPTLEIIDEDTGLTVPVSRLTNVDADGSDGRVTVTLQIAPGDNDRYYVRVDNGDAGLRAIGGYALVTTFDSLLQTDPQTIASYASSAYRFLLNDDIQDIFTAGPQDTLLRDDLHTNDLLSSATPLEPVPGFMEGVKYETVGSISDHSDVDYYAFESADSGAAAMNNVMTMLVESIASPGFETGLTIVDDAGAVVPHNTLLHHGGSQVIQVPHLQDAADYFLRLETDPNAQTTVGSYRVSMRGGTELDSLELWKSGMAQSSPIAFSGNSRTPSNSATEFIYFVRKPELTLFGIQGLGAAGGSLTLTLERIDRSPVLQFSAPSDGFRTDNSVLLNRGAYRVRVQATGKVSIPFEINKATLTDPLAVGFVDVDRTPVYHVGNFDDVFVFPNSGPSSTGQSQTPQPPSSSGTIGYRTTASHRRGASLIATERESASDLVFGEYDDQLFQS